MAKQVVFSETTRQEILRGVNTPEEYHRAIRDTGTAGL